MLRFIITGLGCFLWAVSCVPKQEKQEGARGNLAVLRIGDPVPGTAIEELFDSVGYVQLETTDESLIAKPLILEYCSGRFYVLGFDGQSISAFDESGCFMGKAASPGRGPEEYIRIHSLSVDPQTETVIAADGFSGKIFLYDRDLHLKKVLRTDFTPCFLFAVRGDTLLHYASDLRNEGESPVLDGYDLHLVDSAGNVVRGLIRKRVKNPVNVFAGSSVAFRSGGEVLYLPVLGDTIHRIVADDGAGFRSEPLCRLEFTTKHKRPLGRRELEKAVSTMQDNTLEGYEKRGFIFPSGKLLASDSLLAVELGFFADRWLYLYDVAADRGVTFDPEHMEGDPALRYLAARANLCRGRWFYTIVDPASFKAAADYYRFEGRFRSLADTLDENANPLIFRFRFKRTAE